MISIACSVYIKVIYVSKEEGSILPPCLALSPNICLNGSQDAWGAAHMLALKCCYVSAGCAGFGSCLLQCCTGLARSRPRVS